MVKVTPFLLFDGNCAEAMSFYQSCLGGELTLTMVGDSPMKDQLSPRLQGRIIYARLQSGVIDLSATDWLHPTRVPKQGNTVSLYISDGTYDELRTIFDKISLGADKETLDDLRDLPIGSYGHLADKFGVHWFFKGERRNRTEV
ncbi:MAG: VOC family protein [Polyangia bacterium]|jgi:PhnB protein